MTKKKKKKKYLYAMLPGLNDTYTDKKGDRSRIKWYFDCSEKQTETLDYVVQKQQGHFGCRL